MMIQLAYSHKDNILRDNGIYKSFSYTRIPIPEKGKRLITGKLHNGLCIEALYDETRKENDAINERLLSATITSPPLSPRQDLKNIASRIASEENILLERALNRIQYYVLGAKIGVYTKREETPYYFKGKTQDSNDLEETIRRVERKNKKYYEEAISK
ncbi:MAG: hypothetical protein ACMXYL_03480 [Candidatus Woesearchaeota archaeon]